MVEFLKKIVKEAEKLITNDIEIYEKGNKSDLVTSLDYKIEKYLIKQIKEKYPNYNIVSEEYNSNNNLTDNCFIIDPIDGTINFINNIPLWGIQVACIENGKTVASVIDIPAEKKLYYADKTGAYLNNKKIKVEKGNIKNSMYLVDINDPELIISNIKNINDNYRVFNSMCYSLSSLATSKVHAVVYGKSKPWDIIPGLYLCQQAEAIIYNEKDINIIATDQEFLDMIRDNIK